MICEETIMNKNVEPTLDELLEEPIVRLVMARDGVNADDVRLVMERARYREGLIEIPSSGFLPMMSPATSLDMRATSI